MAFKNRTTEAETSKNEHKALATIRGTLVDVYEGIRYNHLTVNVNRDKVNPKTKKNYYNRLTITADKSINLPNDEAEVIITAEISSFFDRDVNRDKIILSASAVTDTDGAPFEPF